MRVLMLIAHNIPDVRALKEAKSLKKEGYEVTIAAWHRDSSGYEEEQVDGIKVIKIGVLSGFQKRFHQIPYLLRYYLRLWERFKKMRVHIIHAVDLPTLPIAIVLKMKLKASLIYDTYEIYHIMESKKYNKLILWGIATLEKIMVNSFVDVFITVNKNRLEGYYKHILKDLSMVFVVGNYFDYDSWDSSCSRNTSSFRERLGIPVEAKVIGYVGSLNENRCLSFLLEYVAKRPDVYLVIAGRGSPKVEGEVEVYSKKYPNIYYVGWTNEPDIIYRSIDAIYYVMDPTHPYSQFIAPNTLYTAIAYGVPIIALPLGELGDLLGRYPIGIALDDLSEGSMDIALQRLDEIRNYPLKEQIYEELRSLYSWKAAEKNLLMAYALAQRKFGNR